MAHMIGLIRLLRESVFFERFYTAWATTGCRGHQHSESATGTQSGSQDDGVLRAGRDPVRTSRILLAWYFGRRVGTIHFTDQVIRRHVYGADYGDQPRRA